MVARLEEHHDGAGCPHAAREGEAVRSAFERGDVPLERFAGRVLSARVLVALVLAEPILRVS